ncbi:MAG: thermonuclease family protein [Pirellula sp.]
MFRSNRPLRMTLCAALLPLAVVAVASAQDPSAKSSGAKSTGEKPAESAATTDEGPESSIEARVTKIIDGDSIKAKDAEGKEYEIQIEGTDAPELKQAYGPESTDALKKLVSEKSIRVTWKKKDNFERLLAQVYVGDDHINALMIRGGHAWHFKRYNQSKELAALETQAREDKLGLWGTENPQAPWDYRKENRAPDKPDR